MKREGNFRIIALIPNFITSLRIVGTASLFFIDPLTELFYLIYTLSGLSDAVDGWVARATKTTSELGSKLDTIADLLLYAVMIIRIFPELWERLAVWIWYALAAAIIIRLISYSYVAAKFHRLSAMHTYGNKVTGLLAFLVPYFLLLANATPACGVVVIAAVLSSAEELAIHLVSREYDPTHKSIFMLKRKEA